MKYLTVRQPWATLIAYGDKTILTRGKPTPHRGPVTIRAGSTKPVTGGLGDWNTYRDEWRRCWVMEYYGSGFPGAPADRDVPVGAPKGGDAVPVATATLVDCIPIVGPSSAINTHRPGSSFIVDMRSMRGALCLVSAENWPAGESIETQRPYGDFTPGRWAWLLADIERVVA